VEHIGTLIEQSRLGDQVAFARIVRQYQGIPIGFFLMLGYGIRTSRDEDSLRRWYPRNWKAFLPKPEEKTRWQSFWFDLAVMYSVTVIPMIPMFVSYEIMNSMVCWIFFPTMMMTVVTLIASHSAGILGKRLRGHAPDGF